MVHCKKWFIANENPRECVLKSWCLMLLDQLQQFQQFKPPQVRSAHGTLAFDIKLRTEYFEALEVLEVVEATDLVSAGSLELGPSKLGNMGVPQ